jgi:hypothetical protein
MSWWLALSDTRMALAKRWQLCNEFTFIYTTARGSLQFARVKPTGDCSLSALGHSGGLHLRDDPARSGIDSGFGLCKLCLKFGNFGIHALLGGLGFFDNRSE